MATRGTISIDIRASLIEDLASSNTIISIDIENSSIIISISINYSTLLVVLGISRALSRLKVRLLDFIFSLKASRVKIL